MIENDRDEELCRRWDAFRMKITLTIWQYKNTSTIRTSGGFIQISKVLILRHWGIDLTSSQHCQPCNDYNKKQEKNHTCLLALTNTNNGRHAVHLLHDGIGKVTGGLLKIQKVRKDVSQVLSEQGDPFLAVFGKNLRTWLSRIQFVLLHLDRLQLTADYCNRRGVWRQHLKCPVFAMQKCAIINWLQMKIDDHRIQSDYKYKSELQNPEGKKSVLGNASAWWNREPMTTRPSRSRAPSTQRTWTSTREWCTRNPMRAQSRSQILVVIIAHHIVGSSFTCPRHLMVITWWAYLLDFESSSLFYFVIFSFILNLLHFLLHFFHYFEGSRSTAYFAWKEMDSLDDSYLLTHQGQESGWALQGVKSRASFRRLPRNGKSFFTTMSSHINNQFAKKRGIGKKLLLTIRAVMLEEHVDLVALDVNGAAWRRPCGNDRKPTSVIEEAFVDTDLPLPPGAHCGVPVQCQVDGLMCAVFSSHRTPMKGGKYDCTLRLLSPTVSWVFVEKMNAATMKCGCTRHLLTIAETMHRASMISACTSKKDPLRTNSTRKEAGHTENKAKIRTRQKHPYEQYALPLSKIRKTCTTMVDQGPRSMTWRALDSHVFVFLLRGSVIPSPLHHVTLHVTQHLLICLVMKKRQNCQEDTTNSQNHSEAGTTSGELSRRTGRVSIESQPTESKDDTEARKDFWSFQGDFINRHHNEPLVQHWNTLM